MRKTALFVLGTIVARWIVPAAATADDVTLCAAASLRQPLRVVATGFEEESPGSAVRLHCAGSTALRRQIEAGGPCDLFVAAGTEDVDTLQLRGFVRSSQGIAGNRLVLFARRESTACLRWSDLESRLPRHLAIGDPRTAPVGRYALQALTASGALAELRPHLLPCADALQVTSAVTSGAADAGIAYSTDLAHHEDLRECDAVPESLYAPITYTLALLSRGAGSAAAKRFFDFARAPAAHAVFESFGFTAAPAREASAQTPFSLAASPLWRPRRWHPWWLSLRVATVATFLSGSLGLAMAAGLARRRPSWARDLLAACTDLPMVLPPSVLGVVLLEICGPRGILGRHLPFPLAFTWGAAVLASAVVAFPLMVRPARSALEAVPPRYLQAARTLGAGPWRVFWRVQLPLARRGVLAGVLLAFFRALGEFGATLMVAGNIPGKTQTLPLAIYDALFLGQAREAFFWVVAIMLFTFAGALLAQRLQGRAP